MSIPFGEPIGARGECFVTCDCYNIRGDTLGVVLNLVVADKSNCSSYIARIRLAKIVRKMGIRSEFTFMLIAAFFTLHIVARYVGTQRRF